MSVGVLALRKLFFFIDNDAKNNIPATFDSHQGELDKRTAINEHHRSSVHFS